MSDTLKWPTADELRSANGIGRQIEFENARIERDIVLANWRNLVHSILLDVVENKSRQDRFSVRAPTEDKVLARTLAPILVAWLQGVLPGMSVSIESGEFYTYVNISWGNL